MHPGSVNLTSHVHRWGALGLTPQVHIRTFRDGPRLAVEAEGLVAGEVVGGAGEVAEEALEAIVGGFFREVPLAGHGGEVAGRGEDLGDGDGARHRFIAGLAAPAAGEQADA